MKKKTRVVHVNKEPFDVYIGRAQRGTESKWGNPYSHKDGTLAKYKVASREEAIKKYEEYLLNNLQLMNDLYELKGKVLGCWCKSDHKYVECHGDLLADLANIMTTLGITEISAVIEIYRKNKNAFIRNRKNQSSQSSCEPLF